MPAVPDVRDRPAVIYMSYDGMMEPLGQGQVLAYLTPLAADYDIHLISFEKAKDRGRSLEVAALRERLSALGISWHPQAYHKRPKLVSTVYDMSRAVLVATVLARRHRVRLFHARSLLSAAMLRLAVAATRGKLLFDIRGFWTDERVEGGIVRRGSLVERVLRRIERAMFARADHIVTLTQASVEPLRHDPRFGRPAAPITVIPTCADLETFAPGPRSSKRPFTVGYVGQVGAWYQLDAMIDLYKAFVVARPDARLLVVNRGQQAEVRRALRDAGVPDDGAEIVAAARDEVAGHIRCMDVGIVLMIDAFCNLARAPTKLAEYLGCGIPCIGDAQVGDLHAILDREGVGVTVVDHSRAELARAVHRTFALLADPDLSARCVAAASRHFSLADGVDEYRAIYRQLTPA